LLAALAFSKLMLSKRHQFRARIVSLGANSASLGIQFNALLHRRYRLSWHFELAGNPGVERGSITGTNADSILRSVATTIPVRTSTKMNAPKQNRAIYALRTLFPLGLGELGTDRQIGRTRP
jgi:hypothetical protein